MPDPMARAPMRVRSSSLAQPIASEVPAAVPTLNWKAAASRRPRLLATRKQPGSELSGGIHGCALWQQRIRGGSSAPSQCSHDSNGVRARRESNSSMREPVAAPNMKELPLASAEHSAVKHSAVGRPPAIRCTTRVDPGAEERASASHIFAAEAHTSVRGWPLKAQPRQPSGAPSAGHTCKPEAGASTKLTAHTMNSVGAPCNGCTRARALAAEGTAKSCTVPSSLTTAASPSKCGLHSTCAARI